jgi:electron-transferring-flavoprotein dehydrogenase
VPNSLLPKCFHNEGNYVISLGNVCRWLGEQAEALGVEIYPGFAGAEVLFDENGAVKGVATGDMGRLHDGSEGPNFQPGMELHGKYTFFAEGCRGHLGKQLEAQFNLRDGVDPQTYGIGIKELWEIKPGDQLGLVIHSGGWPMEPDTYGGGFLYHWKTTRSPSASSSASATATRTCRPLKNSSASRRIRNPQVPRRRQAHRLRRPRLTAGGLQSLPKLTFPGGVLVGDDAGFLNAARIKGSHCAIKSGMLAAEACFDALAGRTPARRTDRLPGAFKQSWLYEELHQARNFKPWMARA